METTNNGRWFGEVSHFYLLVTLNKSIISSAITKIISSEAFYSGELKNMHISSCFEDFGKGNGSDQDGADKAMRVIKCKLHEQVVRAGVITQ